jgi:hypothetical protein
VSVSEQELMALIAGLAPTSPATPAEVHTLITPAAAPVRTVQIGGDCEFHGPHGLGGCPDCNRFTHQITRNQNRPAPVAPAAAPRCTVTELLITECAHCHPAAALPGLSDAGWGPWFPARYKGRCANCAGRMDEGEQIRADGTGGFLCDRCGQTGERQPGTGIVSAPAGPPPSTIKELRKVLIDYEASRPRSMQKALGPSELGTPCQAQIARKLVGCPRRPVTEPTWAPFQGTAVHASMEHVVAYWNAQLGRIRWLSEDRLQIDPGRPELGVDPIEGNSDAFDLDHGMVVDWKYVGTTALDKLRRGIRMGKPADQQVSTEYRTQAHLYGYGQEKKGRDVRYVRLVLLARSWQYDDSQEWTEEYRPEVAIAAVDRYYATIDMIAALDIAIVPGNVALIPTTQTKEACHWCPFNRPGQPNAWDGCPGDRTIDKITSNATAGLIE